MRPKKIVLLVDANRQTLSERTFLLETRGMRVIPATSFVEALALIEDPPSLPIDVLAVNVALPHAGKLIDSAIHINECIRTLAFSFQSDLARDLIGDFYLPKAVNTPAVFFERVKLLAQRKRGPRKTPTRAVEPPLPVAEVA